MAIFPPKILQLLINQTEDFAFWSDPINPGPWEGFAFQWKYTCILSSPQNHSSMDTRVPFAYDTLDVKIGDWISDNAGNCVKIVSVESADGYNLVVIAEDIGRYNTFKDPNVSGFGGLSSQEAVCFELSSEGYPELGGIVAGYFNNVAVDSIQSRFFGFNLVTEFITVFQEDHTLSVGDFIKIGVEADTYEPCPAEKINEAIGIVNTVNAPKTGNFTFKPLNDIENNVQPPLVGNYGDVFYMDPLNPGKVTSVKPLNNPKPVYIRLETENRAVRLNAIVDDAGDETKSFKVESVTLDQTLFTMPADALDVDLMAINGIENKNFTFDPVSKVLTFDPVATGYGVDELDEVIFVYKS